MHSITIESPAKINLYLNILGKRNDGYHELESLMARISLCDRLRITLNNSSGILLHCSDPALVPNNSIAKAYEVLKETLRTDFGVEVHLKKNIPVGSGLGGASSNAAFFILGVLRLLRKNVSQKLLYQIGARIGSDVNFFLSDSPYALCTGRGEDVSPVSIPARYRYTIVFPRIFSSTKAVYSACSSRLTSDFNNVNILLHALKRRDYTLIDNGIFNALKTAAYSVSPKLARVEQLLHALPVQLCNMTGSGSAFFMFDKGILEQTTLNHLCRREAWMMYKVHTL